MQDPATPHYFSATPTTASSPSSVPLVLPDLSLTLASDRGVFSGSRIDPGTKYLLLDGPPLPTGPVDLLDLGCGYGPIALALALRAPEARVWAVDVNDRAVALCRANAASADVADRVHAVRPDEVPDDVRFTAIWSNPPIRIGKPALHALLGDWLARLLPGGDAVLVVQKHLGADSLTRWLTEAGWPTRRLSSRAGYRLLGVSASPEPPDIGPEGAR